MYQEAAMSTKKNCAILISYSGESSEILQIARLLKNNRVPMIAITSIGENSLSKLADVVLRITTREKAYSKIAGFSSSESISLILDILYSCYFSLDYKANFENKVNLARLTELRQITNQIIEEERPE
jgi:DNA-binding MurR/RpiR family transcriptional regulator